MISKRWACANNKYLENYDPAKPSTYIIYLDANNLYGHAMSQPLPYGEFEWISPLVTTDWILSLEDEAPEGYIFEVDLEYPPHLHTLHNCYPLASETIKINKEKLSPYTLDYMENVPYTSTEKLIPNLNNKKNYVLHYQNLKFYISMGLKIEKIHKILKFKQRAWLKPYIEFNTEQRKQATTSFEKDFFKLMNNSVYGKTMENVRKRVDIQLINNESRAKKMLAAPTFHSFKKFDENLVGVERVKKTVTLNKPLYVGFAILELSKLHMYRFHYEYIKNKYQEKAQLLFTDTDSLTYEIETEDLYQDMAQHHHLFDFSDYPTDHPLHSTTNKKKIGCFKDELNSKQALQFAGLRSKMYSILSGDGAKKTAKGVSKIVIKNKLKHEHYKEAIFHKKVRREIQQRIQSDHHQLFTVKQNKIALSALDDKRYVLADGVHTLAHGHYQIN